MGCKYKNRVYVLLLVWCSCKHIIYIYLLWGSGHWAEGVTSRLQDIYRETGRVRERHRSGHPLTTPHLHDRSIVNSAPQNRMMNATRIQAHLREAPKCHLRPFKTIYICTVCMLDYLQGYASATVVTTTSIISSMESLFSCMNNKGLISSSWTTMLHLIEVASLGNSCWRLANLEWNSLSPDQTRLLDQLSQSIEAHNILPQNHNGLRATLQEEWDTMHLQTISQLVNSMRHHFQAVFDAQAWHVVETLICFTHHCWDDEITHMLSHAFLYFNVLFSWYTTQCREFNTFSRNFTQKPNIMPMLSPLWFYLMLCLFILWHLSWTGCCFYMHDKYWWTDSAGLLSLKISSQVAKTCCTNDHYDCFFFCLFFIRQCLIAEIYLQDTSSDLGNWI